MTPKISTAGQPAHAVVIGLGPMGRAMARSLHTAGHHVTVWNRTPARADELVADGVERAVTPADAARAGDLLVLSLTDYQAMWDVLDTPDAAAALVGRTVVNLSSDTPDRTRAAAQWVHEHGAAFVAGGVMVPAPMVGTDAAYVYYSGDEPAFTAHQHTLRALGDPRLLGSDPGRAQLMYQANLDVFLTTLAGIAHGTALVGTSGIDATAFLPDVLRLVEAIPAMIAADGAAQLGVRIDAGDHAGEGSTNLMMGATADHVHATSAAAGIDTDLPRAVQALYRTVIDAGHGREGWTRTIDAMRRAA